MEFIGELVLTVVCLVTGKIVVPLFTLGRAKVVVAPLRTPPVAHWLPEISRSPDGRFVLNEDAGVVVGLVFWATVVGVGVVIIVRS
jgi:hypothetical protein